MRKLLLTMLSAGAFIPGVTYAENVTIGDKEYEITTLIDRDLGRGVRYTRIKLAEYPLNINMLRVDLTNPYNAVETTQANERLFTTEALASASKRQTYEGHEALGGANANFWCVATQEPYSDQLIGATFNGNLRNGKIITETNCHADQWDNGPSHTGILGITPDKKAYSGNNYTWYGAISSDKIGENEICQTNKIVRDEEIDIYNSFYGSDRTFRCCNQVWNASISKYNFVIEENCATEVYLTINEGQEWTAGRPITFTVKEIKTDAGGGTLGNYDLAILGRGSKKEILNKLAVGDEVTLKYNWIMPDGTPIEFSNLVGGNAQVMVNSELTKFNTSESYNSMIYSRTAYGTNADHTMLYIIVIDKATDPTYGASAGCNTTDMCAIAQHYGVVDLTNCDAGGSAEMLINGKVINKTTESSPRAVANGMIAYSIAPVDNVITRLAFDDVELKAPIYSTYSPKVLGYNQYGALVSDDVQGVVLSCPAEAGTCNGDKFTAAGQGMTSTLTATYNGVSVTKDITIMSAEISLTLKPMLIDASRTYTMAMTATVDGNVYDYDPRTIAWTVEDPTIATVDADGVLHGLKEGKTKVTATVGEFTDESDITVEISPVAVAHHDDWSTWTASGATGIKNAKIEDSVLSFTYGTPRDAYVQVSKDITFYSLPDRLKLTFNSSCPIEKVSCDLRSPSITRSNNANCYVVPANEAASFATKEDVTVEIPISAIGETSDISIYPLTSKQIRFHIVRDSSNAGAQSIQLKDFVAEYDNYESGVKDVKVSEGARLCVYPNPVTAGQFTVSSASAINNIEIFSMTGAKVAQINGDKANVKNVEVQLPAGIYVVRVATADGNANAKIVVK
jgi:hypothetical protein